MDPLKDSTDLLSYIEQNKDTISNINLLGGEPLLQKENHKLFDIVDNETRGYILTNLSVPLKSNKVAQKIISDFPNICWGISFENIGPRFEYVRHRAEWDVLTQNLEYLKGCGVKEINIHPMYNIYTAFNLMEFYDFIADQGINDIFWCAILNPSHFSVFDLPKEMRSAAKQEINRVIEKYRNTFPSIARLEEYREDLSHDKPTIDHKFFKYTKQLETKLHPDKKYSFKELWPELTKTLKKHRLG
jgi:MoaA/NifB/PqqE/SkfB family radical SAM enzyme